MRFVIQVSSDEFVLASLNEGQWDASSSMIHRGRTSCQRGESVRSWVRNDAKRISSNVLAKREEPWGPIINIEKAVTL